MFYVYFAYLFYIIYSFITFQLQLGLPKQALHLLDEVFVTLLTHGTAHDKGTCCLLYARCLAFISMQDKDKSDDQHKKGNEY